MDQIDVLLGGLQALGGLLIAVIAWGLRRALDEAKDSERAVASLRERVVRLEAQSTAIDRLEAKLDQLADDVRDLRERVASWAGPRVS